MLAYLSPQIGVPICVILIFIGIVLLVRAYRNRNKLTQQKIPDSDICKSNNLSDTLTAMHEEMMCLLSARLKQRFNSRQKKQFNENMPLLFDKLGLVKLSDWDDFTKKMVNRVKRRIPKSPEKREKTEWRYKVVGKANEIIKDLADSKEWQVEDLVKVSDWLDGLNIGLRELREKDEKWQSLFKKTKPYMTDPILRGLIYKHISCSYGFCSISLSMSYGSRWAKDSFSKLLYSGMVGSAASPETVDVALSEILEEINNRLKELGKE